jgi:hypothetical protein
MMMMMTGERESWWWTRLVVATTMQKLYFRNYIFCGTSYLIISLFVYLYTSVPYLLVGGDSIPVGNVFQCPKPFLFATHPNELDDDNDDNDDDNGLCQDVSFQIIIIIIVSNVHPS